MIIEIKEVYKCEYCRKLYQLKRFAELHEKMCSKNPENSRKCFGCKHLGKKKTEVYDCEMPRRVELLYCSKIDSFLYPPKVEHKKNWHETDPMPNNPMRRKCDKFESEILN